MPYRGNVTQVTSAGVTTNFSYDVTGMVVGANDGQGHSVAINPAYDTNHAAPGVITPNSQQNLAESFTYSSFLAVTSATGPNSATASTTYDVYARPATTTSVHGAVTTYTYTTSPPTTTATTNGRWTKTTMDGLGRTIKVETGHDTTTVSTVDTEYDSCGCSPLGKVKRVSQPYAPGGTVYWTTNSYDCLGRLVSVSLPGNSGTTNYVYEGNAVTVTDPAGKWKKYTTDALGNLVQVTEPDPSLGNVQTNYTYNLRGQLTQVSMPRGSNTQTRTFTYDLPTGRLMSASNPENGTVSYTYNADGSVANKTDAKNQREVYSYDSYGRMTQIRREPVAGGAEDPCQHITFYYDLNPFDALYTQNGWGRLVAAQYGAYSPCAMGKFKEMYSYTAAGLPTKKLLTRKIAQYQEAIPYYWEATYTYDNEGRMSTFTPPSSRGWTCPNEHYPQDALCPSPSFSYTYDAMGRPVALTQTTEGWVDWVRDVTYNAAGQMTQMAVARIGSSHRTETRQYNALQQLTRLTVTGGGSTKVDYEYRFSATQNNGRITQRKDWLSGEEIEYQYDSLSRLAAAATTGSGGWGQSFGYDGFGNLLSQTVTKGSAPTLSVSVDPATNRISGGGHSYDANGNLTAMSMLTMSYDVANRLVSATHSENGTDKYGYDPSGHRVWRQVPYGGSFTYDYVDFYGVDGKLMATCDAGNYYACGSGTIYFAGRLVEEGFYTSGNNPTATYVQEERLGSVAYRDSQARNYFPYGEEPATTTGDQHKFATYYRDKTTSLDYAQQRYYSRTIARFTTPDPYQASGGPADPQSWNRYSYVQNDPVNYYDPSGLRMERIGRGVIRQGEDEIPFELWSISLPQRAIIESSWQWDALSDDCKNGLRTAMPATRENRLSQDLWLKALQRANAATATLKAAADQYGIDWRMLAAIGVRESGFINREENDGAGVGVGIFQITVSAKSRVTAAVAGDLAMASAWAAKFLAENADEISRNVPGLTSDMLRWSVLASWNTGAGGQISRLNAGQSPDWHTSPIGPRGPNRKYKNDYGRSVLDLMDCFR